jgi:hypothetical protein
VSPLELVDDRFGKLAEELRAGRPVAPAALRERVHALEPRPRRFEVEVPWRRLVPAVAIAGLAAAVGVAGVLGIVHGSSAPSLHAQKGTSLTPLKKQLVPNPGVQERSASAQPYGAALSRTAGRLQQYDAWLRVRVGNRDELSKRTQDALRLTRKLGGYVVWANYAAPSGSGNSNLSLKIPIEHVQAAIAAFSGYGTLVRQRIVLKDLQQHVDDLAARIQRLRVKIAHGGGSAQDRARLAQLLHARASTVKRAQMASLALTMVVGKAKKAAAAPAGRFHRTLDDAGSVLVRELEFLLYALVVAGPLVAIGGVGILAGRSVRRRSDEKLLERS